MTRPDYSGLFPERQGQNLALTVVYVPYSLDSGTCRKRVEQRARRHSREPEMLFIDNLLVRIHLIIKLILVDWPCAMGF